MHVTPEYLPRLATLLPLLSVERAVWRADLPFSRQSWQNRTRLRNPDGWQWITVPVEHGQFGAPIARASIAYHDGWQKRHLKALKYNYSTTPFYEHYAEDLTRLMQARHATLDALNKAGIDLILSWLKHEVQWEQRSEPESVCPEPTRLQPTRPQPIHPEPTRPQPIHPEASRPGADFIHPVYRQNYEGFIPDMSCLDILFNNGPNAIRQLAAAR